MRYVSRVLPLVAIGLMLGAVLILGTGTTVQTAQTSAGAGGGLAGSLDYRSLFVGLLLGLGLAGLTQVQWLDLPRRVVVWILDNEQNMYRFGLAGICIAVLIFY